jgi:hypothetical protein
MPSTFSGFLELVEEALTQLCMIYATIPRFIDYIHKSWHRKDFGFFGSLSFARRSGQ